MTQTPQAVKSRLKGLTGALAILLALTGYFEGNRLVAYHDIGGVPTICRGITHGVYMGEVVTVDDCRQMNTAEALKSLAVVDRLTTVRQPDARRAALADFEYNVGEGRFARSTVLRKLNAGDIRGACNELSRWVYVKRRVIHWQVVRRATERGLCLEGLTR